MALWMRAAAVEDMPAVSEEVAASGGYLRFVLVVRRPVAVIVAFLVDFGGFVKVVGVVEVLVIVVVGSPVLLGDADAYVDVAEIFPFLLGCFCEVRGFFAGGGATASVVVVSTQRVVGIPLVAAGMGTPPMLDSMLDSSVAVESPALSHPLSRGCGCGCGCNWSDWVFTCICGWVCPWSWICILELVMLAPVSFCLGWACCFCCCC